MESTSQYPHITKIYSKNNYWLQFSAGEEINESKYKIRIALPLKFQFAENYANYRQPIENLLVKAIQEGIISSFKVVSLFDFDSMSKEKLLPGSALSKELVKNMEIKELNGTLSIEEKTKLRHLCNPFVIYLPEKINFEQTIELCKKIEDILQNTPGSNLNHLAECDIPLTPHVTFRQEKDENGDYVNIYKANSELLSYLKKSAKESEEFKNLSSLYQNKIKKAKENLEKTDSILPTWRDTLITILSDEISERQLEKNEYKNFFNLGYSKTQKINACECLIEYLMQKRDNVPNDDKNILSDGFLSKKINSFLKDNSTKWSDCPQNIEELCSYYKNIRLKNNISPK